MGVLSVRLPDEVHERWRVYCSSLGLQPGQAVRQAIEQQVPAKAVPMKPAGRGGKKTVNVSLRLTESEREGVRLRAKLDSTSLSGWMAKAIRSALTSTPILAADEAIIVRESNHQLLKIGVNINQIARRLNEQQEAQKKAVQLSELQEIRRQIDLHVGKMNTLVSTINERGELEHG